MLDPVYTVILELYESVSSMRNGFNEHLAFATTVRQFNVVQ